jgi:hypothetical protein
MVKAILLFSTLSCSWLLSAIPTIHVIGDSHAFFSFSPVPFIAQEPSYPEFFCYDYSGADTHLSVPFHLHWIGPRTMHRVGRDGLSFLNVKDLSVKEDDYVVFVFGEIDARCHIGKQSHQQQRPYQDIIRELVNNYIATIVRNKEQYAHLTCVIFGVIPPTDQSFNPDYPTYGSLPERIAITQCLNAELGKACLERGLLFFNVYDACSTPLGDFDKKLSDNIVHIAIAHNEFVRQQLVELLFTL